MPVFPVIVLVKISTHTPLARRDPEVEQEDTAEGISTHTPLARRDAFLYSRTVEGENFYSHASCEA